MNLITRDEWEWLAARRTGIGGTDIAAILGLHPYKTPLQVYHEKLGLVEKEITWPMKLGLKMEPILAEFFIEQTGLAISDCGFRRHGERTWQVGTPDRLTLEDTPRVIELKTVGHRSAHRWDKGSGELPHEYFLQAQWYLSLLGLNEAAIAALIGNTDFQIFPIHADTELHGLMLEAGARFWRDHIEVQNPPLPTGEKVDTELLKRIYKHSQETILPADEKQERLLKVYAEWNNTVKSVELAYNKVKNEVKTAIGEATGLESAEFLATWKQDKPRKEIDWEAIAQDMFTNYHKDGKFQEAIIHSYTKQKDGSRRFLFKEKN